MPDPTSGDRSEASQHWPPRKFWSAAWTMQRICQQHAIWTAADRLLPWFGPNALSFLLGAGGLGMHISALAYYTALTLNLVMGINEH